MTTEDTDPTAEPTSTEGTATDSNAEITVPTEQDLFGEHTELITVLGPHVAQQYDSRLWRRIG